MRAGTRCWIINLKKWIQESGIKNEVLSTIINLFFFYFKLTKLINLGNEKWVRCGYFFTNFLFRLNLIFLIKTNCFYQKKTMSGWWTAFMATKK
jgi:hypothetical protein